MVLIDTLFYVASFAFVFAILAEWLCIWHNQVCARLVVHILLLFPLPLSVLDLLYRYTIAEPSIVSCYFVLGDLMCADGATSNNAP